MLVLSDQEVRKHAQIWQIIEENEVAFRDLVKGHADVPQRLIMTVHGVAGASLFKPCNIMKHDGGFGVKVIHVRPDNALKGIGTTPASIQLFDKVTGEVLCMMNGTYLTALRTAAGSAVATKRLAKPDSKRLVVFGSGIQAEAHTKAMCCVRDIEHVTVVNRTEENGAKLVETLGTSLIGMIVDGKTQRKLETVPTFQVLQSDDVENVEKAVRAADIICTATGSPNPLFPGEWLQDGVHVNAIGSYQPHTTELDAETVKRAEHLIIDTPEAWHAGDLKMPLDQEIISKDGAIELGLFCDLPNDQIDASKISLYKAVGNAVQDISTAASIYKFCCTHKIGVELEF